MGTLRIRADRRLVTGLLSLLLLCHLTPMVFSVSVRAQETSTTVGRPPQRLPDTRRPLDRARLGAAGLQVLESRRLLLVTDVPLKQVQGIPEAVDALFDQLQQKLGVLAADASGKEFQVTGYLMDAPERFQEAGLLPDEEFVIRHGRHLGYEFWMNNQATDYYRRHLLFHEFVHCFLMCEHGMRDIPPLWYTEGVAEYFATHTVNPLQFGILPSGETGFEGWGRITELRKTALLTDATEPVTLESILQPKSREFTSELRYAQAWGLVWLLRTHPQLRPTFGELSRVRTRREFDTVLQRLTPELTVRLKIVWLLLLDSLEEGYEVSHAFPELDPKWQIRDDTSDTSVQIRVSADKGWQASGLFFSKPLDITLSGSGRCAVHDQPQRWEAEAQGITLDYAHDRPLGELTAALVSRDGRSVVRRIPVGRGCTLSVEANTELWLQVNDSDASRSGNSGGFDVQIELKAGGLKKGVRNQ